jgi:hypothetical protein
VKRDAELPDLAVTEIIKVEHLFDIGEAKAKPPASQDELETRSIASGKNARLAFAGRVDEVFVFVKAQSSWRDAELPRKIGDRIGIQCHTHGIVYVYINVE